MLTWTLRIRLPAAAVTVTGACGLTLELPPPGEMTGGTLLAVGPAPPPGLPLPSRPR